MDQNIQAKMDHFFGLLTGFMNATAEAQVRVLSSVPETERATVLMVTHRQTLDCLENIVNGQSAELLIDLLGSKL